jgi:hypothetical protein
MKELIVIQNDGTTEYFDPIDGDTVFSFFVGAYEYTFTIDDLKSIEIKDVTY